MPSTFNQGGQAEKSFVYVYEHQRCGVVIHLIKNGCSYRLVSTSIQNLSYHDSKALWDSYELTL